MDQSKLVRSYSVEPHEKQGFPVSKDEFYKISATGSLHEQRVVVTPQQTGEETFYLAENKNDSMVTIKIYKR